MRAREFITEQRAQLDPGQAGPLQHTYILPGIRNNDAYHAMRFGVAMARARAEVGGATDLPDYTEESAFGQNAIISGFNDSVEDVIELGEQRVAEGLPHAPVPMAGAHADTGQRAKADTAGKQVVETPKWTFAGRLTYDIGKFQIGVQGKFRLTGAYDEFLRNRSDSYRTPYLGTGTNTLTLPNTWMVPYIPSSSATNNRGQSVSARGLVASITNAARIGLLDKVTAAAKFNQGYSTTELVAANVIDQAWHQLAPADVPNADGVLAFEAAALKKAGVDVDRLTLAPAGSAI